MTKPIWTPNDAWVLQSLKLSTEDNSGATIARLLRVGDFINRDIIDLDTLRSAILKLGNADLVYVKNEQVFMTEKCLQLIANWCTSKQIHKYRDQLHNMLNSIDIKIHQNVDINFLNKQFYETAYKQYEDSFK
jgi:hypothetical protein